MHALRTLLRTSTNELVYNHQKSDNPNKKKKKKTLCCGVPMVNEHNSKGYANLWFK